VLLIMTFLGASRTVNEKRTLKTKNPVRSSLGDKVLALSVIGCILDVFVGAAILTTVKETEEPMPENEHRVSNVVYIAEKFDPDLPEIDIPTLPIEELLPPPISE